MDGAIMQGLLAQAEKLYTQRSIRLTSQRLKVLRLINLQEDVISTYNLLGLLRETEPQAKPPTVYHALDFLPGQGSMHKVGFTSSYMLCRLFGRPTHSSAMFICDRCGVARKECTGGVEDIIHTLAAKMGFVLRYGAIEAHGLCPACAEVKSYRHPSECQCDRMIQVEKKVGRQASGRAYILIFSGRKG